PRIPSCDTALPLSPRRGLRRLARRLAEDTLSKGTDMDDARPPVRSRKSRAEPVGWELVVDSAACTASMSTVTTNTASINTVCVTTVVHYYGRSAVLARAALPGGRAGSGALSRRAALRAIGAAAVAGSVGG